MGLISLQIPVVGQPNTTEDPKIATDFTTIQAWANGNVDDSNLLSPNAGVRKLLLQVNGRITSNGSTPTLGDYLFVEGAYCKLGNSSTSSLNLEPPIWLGDAGWQSQPTDFQVANKTAYCRIKVTVVTNSVAPGVNLGCNLYLISSITGSGAITYNGSAVAGSATNTLTTPGALLVQAMESGQFAMPLTNQYALGVNLTGTPANGSIMAFTAQLFGYNA